MAAINADEPALSPVENILDSAQGKIYVSLLKNLNSALKLNLTYCPQRNIIRYHLLISYAPNKQRSIGNMKTVISASIVLAAMAFLSNAQEKTCVGIMPVASAIPGMVQQSDGGDVKARMLKNQQVMARIASEQEQNKDREGNCARDAEMQGANVDSLKRLYDSLKTASIALQAKYDSIGLEVNNENDQIQASAQAQGAEADRASEQGNLYREMNGSTDAFTDALTAAFSKAKRFALVDRAKLGQINQEKKLQRSEDFIDGQTIDQGKSLGAQYLISSSLNTYSNNGTICKFTLGVNIIDVATGRIITSDVITAAGGYGTAVAKTALGLMFAASSNSAPVQQRPPTVSEKTDALRKALSSVNDQILAFIQKNFPVTFSIAEIQDRDKKGNVKQILIAGGSEAGLQKGDRLKVVEMAEIEVDGRVMQRKKEIGDVKITKVEDENFSICEVKDGEDVIGSRYDAKAKLKVVGSVDR
jgi:hypothetical protein